MLAITSSRFSTDKNDKPNMKFKDRFNKNIARVSDQICEQALLGMIISVPLVFLIWKIVF